MLMDSISFELLQLLLNIIIYYLFYIAYYIIKRIYSMLTFKILNNIYGYNYYSANIIK
jgi:hypothetical protein